MECECMELGSSLPCPNSHHYYTHCQKKIVMSLNVTHFWFCAIHLKCKFHKIPKRYFLILHCNLYSKVLRLCSQQEPFDITAGGGGRSLSKGTSFFIFMLLNVQCF